MPQSYLHDQLATVVLDALLVRTASLDARSLREAVQAASVRGNGMRNQL